VTAVTDAKSARTVGSIGNVRSVVKVGKRSRFRKMTRAKIERLWNHARKTWVMVNETLKNGKWNHKGEDNDNENDNDNASNLGISDDANNSDSEN